MFGVEVLGVHDETLLFSMLILFVSVVLIGAIGVKRGAITTLFVLIGFVGVELEMVLAVAAWTGMTLVLVVRLVLFGVVIVLVVVGVLVGVFGVVIDSPDIFDVALVLACVCLDFDLLVKDGTLKQRNEETNVNKQKYE